MDQKYDTYSDADVPGVPSKAFEHLDEAMREVGGEWTVPEDEIDSIGRTMFDLPQSKDDQLVVLMPPDNIAELPSQSLIRIRSKKDGHDYIGIVFEGPFAEPDGLRADSSIVVTTTVRGGIFMPKYHGRVHVSVLGELMQNGKLMPPRFRPLPNSPVYALDDAETARYLQLEGDLQMGLVVGYENLELKLPSSKKMVLPRHLGIIGTTGGGKSTTVARLVSEGQKAGISIIVFDTEGEYTFLAEATDDETMLSILQERGLAPGGVEAVQLLRLVGRDGTNPDYAPQVEFTLAFDRLSPYMLMEILELSEAQQARYLAAYDIAKFLLREFSVFPTNEAEEKQMLELDEMESGFPRLTLQQMYDVVRACAHHMGKNKDLPYIGDPTFRREGEHFMEVIRGRELPSNVTSWRALQGKLSRLLRLGIFDNHKGTSPDYKQITEPGRVTIVDLSDTESPQIRNLALAELLRGLQAQQDENYKNSQADHAELRRVMVIIEEAHEFLSRERIQQMPVLFQQVSRIARRGRKRWLSLVFVTQSPQHLPDELLGLINNFIFHKISDGNVINNLKRSVGKIDDGQWKRMTSLSQGQAIVSVEGFTRPLLVTIDPTPCKLRMTD